MKTWVKILIAAVAIGVLAGAGVLIYSFYADKPQVIMQTEEVEEGDLMSVISASGTVEPEELVNVGAQVSGKIMAFGRDAEGRSIDYGSKVASGMLLAKIDDVLYKAALSEAEAQKRQAEAAIASADALLVKTEAQILSAEASLKQAEAQRNLAKSNYERAQKRKATRTISDADFDACKGEYEVRVANVASAQAELRSAQSQLVSAKAERKSAEAKLAIADAALVKAQRNLDYCTITSPVDGVVIERRVSVGQTLVSNMSASSIFLIAKDLKKMQVWVSVNEADIGSIHVGMPVVFTVDAYPGREFEGKVHKIRLNATMSQNVVTYVVEVSTDNRDGKLLPYLTANVKFVRQRKNKVLHVSNAAVRFTPPDEFVTPEGLKILREFKKEGRRRLIWVKAGNDKLRPIEVQVGLNNGVASEIVTDKLKKGDVVVNSVRAATPEEVAQRKSGSSRSPFLPDPPKRRANNPNKPAQGSAGPR